MGWIETRQCNTETTVEYLRRRLHDLEDEVAALRDRLRATAQQLPQSPPPAEGGGGYFAAYLSAGLTHGSSVGGIEVWTMPGRPVVTPSATIYNDGPGESNDVPAESTVILQPNPGQTDSYTIIGVYCP